MKKRIWKRLGLFAAGAAAMLVMAAAFNETKSNYLIQWLNGTIVTLDTSAKIRADDSSWSLSYVQLSRLGNLQSGAASNVNANLVTNTFSPAFPSAPFVTVGGATNCSVITVTTTNVVLWAPATNQVIFWRASN